MPKVLVLDTDYNAIGGALDRVFEEFPLDVAGKRVLVKPNMLGPYAPETHVNTNPALVSELVESLDDCGAHVIVSDNPGTQGYGAVEKSARVSGVKNASRGRFRNISTEVVNLFLDGTATRVNVSREVLEADVLISLPKFKTHTFTKMTGAIKNSFGFIVGGDKARLHLEFPDYKPFSEILVDVYKIRIPDLVIVDAVVGIQGNGPTAKSLYSPGKLMASDDGVAVDSVMANMMGFEPASVRMIEYAFEQGLGEMRLSQIDVVGRADRLKGFRRPVPRIPQLFGGTWIGAFFPDIGHPHFDIDTESCSGCGSCGEACPAGAIEIEENRPSYDYSKCISCYCCMELCPNQAISIHDTIRTRIYRRLGYLQVGD